MGNQEGIGSSMVAIVALVILVIVGVAFVVYGLPALQNASQPDMPKTIEVKIPAPTDAQPQ